MERLEYERVIHHIIGSREAEEYEDRVKVLRFGSEEVMNDLGEVSVSGVP